MVTANAADATLTLPATSVALVVMLWMPLARAEVVTLQYPVRQRRHSCPDLGRPIEDRDRAALFRRAGEGRRRVVGDVVPCHAAVDAGDSTRRGRGGGRNSCR